MLVKNVIVGDLDSKYEHPLAEIVNIASQCEANITLEYENYHINAKSIMGIIAFNPSSGMNVTIRIDGSDEEASMKQMESFLMC